MSQQRIKGFLFFFGYNTLWIFFVILSQNYEPLKVVIDKAMSTLLIVLVMVQYVGGIIMAINIAERKVEK